MKNCLINNKNQFFYRVYLFFNNRPRFRPIEVNLRATKCIKSRVRIDFIQLSDVIPSYWLRRQFFKLCFYYNQVLVLKTTFTRLDPSISPQQLPRKCRQILIGRSRWLKLINFGCITRSMFLIIIYKGVVTLATEVSFSIVLLLPSSVPLANKLDLSEAFLNFLNTEETLDETFSVGHPVYIFNTNIKKLIFYIRVVFV